MRKIGQTGSTWVSQDLLEPHEIILWLESLNLYLGRDLLQICVPVNATAVHKIRICMILT